MAALFVEGRAGQGSDHGVWGGVKFYFGQKDKSLIRRHREDDPPINLGDTTSTFVNAGGTTPVASTGPRPLIVGL